MTKAKKYIKRPREFEIIQYTGKNGKEIEEWSEGNIVEIKGEEKNFPEYVYLRILKNNFSALVGYYIIKNGEDFYCCTSEHFLENYQLLK